MRTFNKENQELEINVNSTSGNDNCYGDNSQYLLPKDSLYYETQSVNPGKTFRKEKEEKDNNLNAPSD